jgi:predicted AlkP superfamily pyrophosphatase or phosphodiesterase
MSGAGYWPTAVFPSINVEIMNTQKYRLSLFVIVAGLTALVVLASPIAAAAPDPDRIVVLMSIDGLANFYMDDPAAEMPTIRKLVAEGAKAASMKASNPTVTWPNHTTLVTGVSPALHGVVGNNFFDRVKGEKVALIWDPVYAKDEIVKVPTIYDVAKAAGLKTAAIRWPATRKAKSLDWTSPDVGEDAVLLKSTTPSLLADCKAAGISLTQSTDGSGKIGKQSLAESISLDDMWTRVFNMIVEKYRPNLALLHVVAVDHTEHADGPRSPEAYAAIQAADNQVREVWDVLQRNFPGKATLIVVSDHGFSLNKTEVRPNVVLKELGLVEADGGKVKGGAVYIVPQGGSAMVYITDESRRDSIAKQIKDAFASVEGIESIIDAEQFPAYGIANPRRDPRAPDLMLFAQMGHYFGDTAAGTVPTETKGERRGSHGHDANLPDLRAVFIASGAGIRPGVELGPIDNRDVAPTIARLLGLEMPGVEGKPLLDAIAK